MIPSERWTPVRPDRSRATVLTTTEFQVAWEVLGLGETPWQLDPRPAGATLDARRAIVEATRTRLHRRGLGDGYGPGPWLAGAIRRCSRRGRAGGSPGWTPHGRPGRGIDRPR